MYYDYEDKRYHEGDAPETGADHAEPKLDAASPDTDDTKPLYTPYDGKTAPAWSEPSYRAADEKTGYSPSYHNPSAGYSAYNRYPSQPWEKQELQKKKHSGVGKRIAGAVCLVVVCALVSATVGYGVADHMIGKIESPGGNQVVLGSSPAGAGTAQADKAGAAELVTTGDVMSASEIYSLSCEQVVGIQTSASNVNVFGQATTTPAVSGSGFIISSDGYIATNYHVIEYAVVYGAQYGYAVSVIMEDGTTYDAEIIGYEKDNDVAVLKIEASGLNAVTIGSSADMRVGETIYVVGNPLGELEYTMTGGIVSALDRVITTADSVAVNMFQIDAAVNSGNSGGPVYNSRGEVIGIVTAKYSSTGVEGLGFAIPMDDAVNIVSDLIEHGYVTGKAYMGVYVRTVGSAIAQYYNLPEGAYIDSIVAGYAAEAAGIQASDIITKVGDTTVTGKESLKSALRSYSSGDTATVNVYRNGQSLDFSVTFDEAPQTSETATIPNPGDTTQSGT